MEWLLLCVCARTQARKPTKSYIHKHAYKYACMHLRRCISLAYQRCLVLHLHARMLADTKTFMHAYKHALTSYIWIEYIHSICQLLCVCIRMDVCACDHVHMNMRMHGYIHSHSKARLESTCSMLFGSMGIHACAHAHIFTHSLTHSLTHTGAVKLISNTHVSGLNLKRCMCGMYVVT